jgi:hypothetical protein
MASSIMPSTPQNRHTSRDERIRIQTLRDVGFNYREIYLFFNGRLSYRQIQNACCTSRPTPKKRSGRPPILSEEQVDEVELFVRATRASRLLSYENLAWGPFRKFGVGPVAIKNALERRGYRRYVARRKPVISEENKRERLQFALEHVDWSQEQWSSILWTDETWVTGIRHRKQYVTRKRDEELDPTCVLDKISRPKGWMFWGCFAGNEKGPGIFWEKEWGSINSESYCERIVPLIHGWLRLRPRLRLMQDNAKPHIARMTTQELIERGVVIIRWPAYSPDLNPIETVWNWMKDWIEREYGEQKWTYDVLRQAVIQAWNAITTEQLNELVTSMRQRCLDVIAASGGHTKW